MIRFLKTACALTLLIAAAACEEPGDKVLGIDARGVLRGAAFLDRDGDLTVSQPDAPFPRLRVTIVPANSNVTIATATTDSLGFFTVRDLPVGSYRVITDAGSAGDTVSISKIQYGLLPGQTDTTHFTVIAADTASALVTLSYVTPKLIDVAKLPKGRRVSLNVTALNSLVTFGDSTLHLADSTGAIRAVDVKPANITIGDVLRVLATVGERDGKPALVDFTPINGRPGTLPTAIDITTAQAAAAGGKLDANQVRVRNATVLDASSLAGGDVLFTVDDGSGPLQLLIDVNAGVTTPLPINRGAQLDATGVLVPLTDGSGKWRLKPRRGLDLSVRYPAVTIATARTRQPGQFVTVRAITVNDLTTFGDLTLHLTDATGSIRVFARNAFISAGDSVEVLGLIGIRDGQPALLDASVSVLARRTVPAPATVSTLQASNADGGRLDAALVKISNASVTDTIPRVNVNADVRFVVNDSTGALTVTLDADWWLSSSRVVPQIGSKVDITGVLVPSGDRVWTLKPRNAADVVITAPPPAPAPAARPALNMRITMRGDGIEPPQQ